MIEGILDLFFINTFLRAIQVQTFGLNEVLLVHTSIASVHRIVYTFS